MEDYNDEPVLYCTNCLSLRIEETVLRNTEIKQDFCGVCGDPNIEETDIETWEALYVNLYGRHYVKRNKYLGDKGSGKKHID